MHDAERSYEAPQLTAYGKVSEITQANACPGSLDATFPTNTDFADVQCS